MQGSDEAIIRKNLNNYCIPLKEFVFCKMQALCLQRPCSNISIVKLEHVATGRIIILSKKCITVLESLKNCFSLKM